MKLKTFHTIIFNQIPRFSGPHSALVRIYAGKGDHHIGVCHCTFGYLFIRNALFTDFVLRINGKHDKCHVLLLDNNQQSVGWLAAPWI